MKEFFDTSVLMAAFWKGHPGHDASIRLVASASPKRSACGVHTLAEVYAGMTVLPVKEIIPPEQVLLFVQEIRQRCTLVGLDEAEYAATIEDAALKGLVSGRIYDAILLRCAVKAKAERIYTWNLKQFRGIAPELAKRIFAPG